MRPGSMRRAPAIGPALPLFSERLLQDRLVERQVGDDLLELPILLAELPELAHLRGPQIAEALLPALVGLLADPVLPAQLDHWHAAVPLPEDVHHLLRRELARPHRPRPPSAWGPCGGSLREALWLRNGGQAQMDTCASSALPWRGVRLGYDARARLKIIPAVVWPSMVAATI